MHARTMKESDNRILVILPCHNESGRVSQVVKSIHDTLNDAEILVIDNASENRARIYNK